MQRTVNTGSRILLHPRDDVRIEIKRDPDLGMAEALAGDLGVNAAVAVSRDAA